MVKKFHIPYGDHPSQYGVLRMPAIAEPSPVVITIHGGFWQSKYDLEENTPLAEDLTKRGYATWNIEYRRVGEEGGGWPGTLGDIIDAVNHLGQLVDRFQLDLSRVIVLGHSAGGQLALWVAAQNKNRQMSKMEQSLLISIRGVISLAGVLDLRKMVETHERKGMMSPLTSFIGGSPQEVSERYHLASPIELLPLGIPQVLLHGEVDRHVPVGLSVEYSRRAIELGDEVSLVVLPEVEHFMVIDPSSDAWKEVISSLEFFK